MLFILLVLTFNFYSVIKRLNDIDSPVMGCNLKPHLDAHAKIPCLGFLSEEHFIVLSVTIENPLQINLKECSNCRNGFIASFLKKELLNKTFDLLNEKTKEAILVNYYYDLSVDKECNHCFACVGMCRIKQGLTGKNPFVFNHV